MRSLLFLSLFVPLVATALDLTPTRGTRNLEGMKVPILYFKGDGGTIRYQPPSGWDVSGGGALLQFTKPEDSGANIKWQIILRRADQAPAETSEAMAKWAKTVIPPAAGDASLVATNSSPYTLDGRPSTEYIFSYHVGGRSLRKSLSYCDLSERERLVIVISGDGDKFNAIRDAAISSLFSWSRTD